LVGGNITTGINPYMVAWSPDDKYLAVVNNGGNTLQVFTVNYQVDRSSPTLSNCITLGNSAQGAAADLDIHLLGGAQVEINGLIDHDAS
jgi:DNA-binding beta-propeller fold protein YncE